MVCEIAHCEYNGATIYTLIYRQLSAHTFLYLRDLNYKNTSSTS